MSRPAKKNTTVDELKGMLGSMGLETKGKRETLWKRLFNHFKRSPTVHTTVKAPVDPSDASDSPPGSPAQTLTLPAEAARTSEKKWGKQPIRAFLCFDVEATCRGGKEFDWPNEIIEFPVVLLRWAEDVEEDEGIESVNATDRDDIRAQEHSNTEAGPSKPSSVKPSGPRLVVVDKFHSYVRPVWQPQLSEFCTRFTGITQEMVDAAPTFPAVLKKLEEWMDSHGLRQLEEGEAVEGLVDAVWVTDGPWDLRDFIPKQLHITPCDPPSPLYLRQPYLNIKQAFQSVLSEEYRRQQYALSHPNAPPNERALSRITTGKLVGKKNQDKMAGLGFYSTIPGMLGKLGLGAFEGRQHCGLDDATNVARILQALVEKDILVEANGRLPPPKNAKKWPWMGKPGEVNWEEWMSDAKRPVAASTPTTTTAAAPTAPASPPTAGTSDSTEANAKEERGIPIGAEAELGPADEAPILAPIAGEAGDTTGSGAKMVVQPIDLKAGADEGAHSSVAPA